MAQIMPWARLIRDIKPEYPTAGRLGRQPIGVIRMLWHVKPANLV